MEGRNRNMKKAPKRLPGGFTYIENRQMLKLQFTVNNRRYAVYGNSVKECEEKKEEKKELLKNSLHLDKQKVTLRNYYNSVWLEEQKKTVKDSTLWYYSKQWGYIDELLGNRKISCIQKADAIEFQNRLLKEGKSAKLVNRCTKLLRQVLQTAVVDRIISFNPCEGVKMLKDESPKASETNHRALTQEETGTFLRYAEDSNYYHLFRFLLETGVRISEALALTWNDVDFVKREIRIDKTIARTSGKGFEVSDSTKTASSTRMIPITESVAAILKAQEKRNMMLYAMPFDKRIFLNAKGKTSNYNTVNVCIGHIIKQINLEGYHMEWFSAHAFRDTFATRCIEQGMQPHTLRTLLGHSSLKMTMDLYAHVMPNTKYEEMSKIRIV